MNVMLWLYGTRSMYGYDGPMYVRTTCLFRFVEMAFCIELSSIGWALTNRCLIDGLLPLGRFFLTHYIGGPLHI